jgi:hypothetical protein
MFKERLNEIDKTNVLIIYFKNKKVNSEKITPFSLFTLCFLLYTTTVGVDCSHVPLVLRNTGR